MAWIRSHKKSSGGGGNAMQLLDQSTLIADHMIHNNEEVIEQAGWSATDWIDIHQFSTLYVNAISCDYTCWYNENKVKVSGTPLRQGANSTYGYYYIRFSNTTGNMTNSGFKVFGEFTS